MCQACRGEACRVGAIISKGGRQAHDVWLEVSTGLVKLRAQTKA